MSVNINVALAIPLQVIAAIKNRADNTDTITGLNTALVKNSQAVVKAVDAIPYNIAPEHAQSRNRSSQEQYTIDARMLAGELTHALISRDTTISELVRKIEAADGIPPCQQRIIFAGRRLQHSFGRDEDEEDTHGHQALTEWGIGPGSTFHLMPRLGGS